MHAPDGSPVAVYLRFPERGEGELVERALPPLAWSPEASDTLRIDRHRRRGRPRRGGWTFGRWLDGDRGWFIAR